jgi:hypothetical protein
LDIALTVDGYEQVYADVLQRASREVVVVSMPQRQRSKAPSSATGHELSISPGGQAIAAAATAYHLRKDTP